MNSTAIPWYKSKIIVGALASVATKALVAVGLPGDLVGAGSEQLANLATLGLGAIADAVILRSRAKQVEAPMIVARKGTAEAMTRHAEHLRDNAALVAQEAWLSDQAAQDERANGNPVNVALVDEVIPSQSSAIHMPLENKIDEPEVDTFEREIAFGSLVDSDFKEAVLWIEEQIGLDPDKLMCCMHFETGGTFSPSVKNAAGSSGLGLIQFMRATIEGSKGMLSRYAPLRKLARKHSDLAGLSAVQQLSFVYYYFQAFGSDLSDWSLEDVYMAILFPRAIGKPLSWHMPWAAGSLAYKQNAGLDLNRDRVITKAEAAAGVTKRWALGQQLKG